MSESLTLGGCAPTPLASYLKGLSILRLVSSDQNHVCGRAADPKARGWWEHERFHLQTTLDQGALCRFFLEDYAPSPIIAPWNGGSGFFPNDNKDGLKPLTSNTVAERFASIAEAIQIASRVIKHRAFKKRPRGDAKVEFAAALRAELPAPAIHWIDAVLTLSGERLAYPQLLGTGGNDGRLDFTNNFMRRLVSKKRPRGIFDAASGRPTVEGRSLLANALFGVPSRELGSFVIGQFAPGAAGGPNTTVGYEADGKVNPWDFVLMLEGAVAFAGAATRRHQSTFESKASSPFTVRTVGAGWGGIEASDENDARAEFWAPLWHRPTRFCEIDALLREGRAVLNGRTARDGLDFARAVASLGVSRGFSEFQRFGFLMRSGKAYFATPTGRRSVASSPTARLVADLDASGWLNRVRRVGRSEGEPAAARSAIKRFEDALFELVIPTAPSERIERALVALGDVCGWLAVSRSGREAVRTPPPAMSSDWIRLADDASPEFRGAAALAGLGLPPNGRTDDRETGSGETLHMQSKMPPPMAAHFAPIDEDCFFGRSRLRVRRAWSSDDASCTVVWSPGNLISNMIAVLERRLVEAAIRGVGEKPFGSAALAQLSDVSAFLTDGFDDSRCAALLAGMVWVRPAWLPVKDPGDANVFFAPVPFAYAAIKPIFSPNRALRRIGAVRDAARLPIPPGLIARLRAGGAATNGSATDAAARLALARASSSGLPSAFESARAGGRRAVVEGGRIGAGLQADRLAAALLIPVGHKALNILVKRAYTVTLSEAEDEHTEEMNHAA